MIWNNTLYQDSSVTSLNQDYVISKQDLRSSRAEWQLLLFDYKTEQPFTNTSEYDAIQNLHLSLAHWTKVVY